jgi:hypothetical protein
VAGGIVQSLTGCVVGGEGGAGALDGFASLIFGGWLPQGASASPACACLGTGVALEAAHSSVARAGSFGPGAFLTAAAVAWR